MKYFLCAPVHRLRNTALAPQKHNWAWWGMGSLNAIPSALKFSNREPPSHYFWPCSFMFKKKPYRIEPQCQKRNFELDPDSGSDRLRPDQVMFNFLNLFLLQILWPTFNYSPFVHFLTFIIPAPWGLLKI